MAHAEIDVVLVHKIFDRKYESGAKALARRIAEKAIKSSFEAGPPKQADARWWSVDLALTVQLDPDSRRLTAGCGVLLNIRQGRKKLLHANQSPNRAMQQVDPARLAPRDIDEVIALAVESAMDKPVAAMKAGARAL